MCRTENDTHIILSHYCVVQPMLSEHCFYIYFFTLKTIVAYRLVKQHCRRFNNESTWHSFFFSKTENHHLQRALDTLTVRI